MFESTVIRADHKDVIHDVAYDFYGQRMATCSSDQMVKVWEKDESGNWVICASWKAHSGSIWRLTWVHPEFGQVLATCSFDRTACIWEEVYGDKIKPAMSPVKRWIKRTNLVDSRTSVTDVKFSPKCLGLLLATSSADGVIRIYEAADIMNLAQWSLQHEISCKLPLSCITWNQSTSRLHPPMIAAGSDEIGLNAGGKIFIFEYSENIRKWTKIETISSINEAVHDLSFAPNMGRSFHLLAVASKDLHIISLKPVPEMTGNQRLDVLTVAQFNDHRCTVWRVSWNVTGTMLASTGDDGSVRIWKMNYMKNWKCAAELKALVTQTLDDSFFFTSTPNSTLLSTGTAKYYKRGTISNSNQVPWH